MRASRSLASMRTSCCSVAICRRLGGGSTGIAIARSRARSLADAPGIGAGASDIEHHRRVDALAASLEGKVAVGDPLDEMARPAAARGNGRSQVAVVERQVAYLLWQEVLCLGDVDELLKPCCEQRRAVAGGNLHTARDDAALREVGGPCRERSAGAWRLPIVLEELAQCQHRILERHLGRVLCPAVAHRPCAAAFAVSSSAGEGRRMLCANQSTDSRATSSSAPGSSKRCVACGTTESRLGRRRYSWASRLSSRTCQS